MRRREGSIASSLNRPFPMKDRTKYRSVIPLKVFQTWCTHDLPPAMRARADALKAQNPEFEFVLHDDGECREFIRTHFRPDVLNAYDRLIPGAYKADLWRYCVLYIHGGIYLDIKLACVNGFKLIALTEREHLVRDRVLPLSIYNACLVVRPKNALMWKAIYRVVWNVQNRLYGKGPLWPTGPEMLGRVLLNGKNRLALPIDMSHYAGGGFIVYQNRFVLSTEYAQYNGERNDANRRNHITRYDEMWHQRRIYR